MKIRILATLILFVICTSVAFSQTPGGRGGVNWNGGNSLQSSAQITDVANKIAATGANWVFISLIWFWSEPNAPTATPQGPHSYFGPRVQQ